jgi:secreted trypsin-like serine protease
MSACTADWPEKAQTTASLYVKETKPEAAPSPSQFVQASNRRIVGGVETTIRQHPWQVAVQIGSGGDGHLCGGSLVAARWVVTAAHCFARGIRPGDVKIKAGATNYAGEGEWTGVDKIVLHDAYNWQSHENDIALIKLAAVTSGRAIRFAAAREPLREAQLLEVTGWGATSEGGPASRNLKKVQVPLVSNATCNRPEAYQNGVGPGMICAGSRDGGVDACQGDSGGPLVKRGESGPVLVGVVSFGEGCARKLKYGVYTRISHYHGWIERIVGGDPV